VKDLGITLVRQFQSVFGAFIGTKPEVPVYSNEYTAGALASYHVAASELGERLKKNAQSAREQGDEAGALVLIRLQLIQEELAELAEGIINRDIVECFDALVDISYVVDGTYITLGLDEYKSLGLREVHRSNMSKLGENSEPVTSSAGRIVKGPNYSPPELERILKHTLVEHHSDDDAVDNFAEAMKDKLAKKRADGRGGWEDSTDATMRARLSSMLRDHVMKGDPVDVANLAMMLHQRGERIL
jgi:predicted HAD superfamily Cof-like phosphohydrolase